MTPEPKTLADLARMNEEDMARRVPDPIQRQEAIDKMDQTFAFTKHGHTVACLLIGLLEATGHGKRDERNEIVKALGESVADFNKLPPFLRGTVIKSLREAFKALFGTFNLMDLIDNITPQQPDPNHNPFQLSGNKPIIH